MSLRVIWQYMDRSVTQKILYYIFLVTDRSIYCHMILSAMNYLLYNFIFKDRGVRGRIVVGFITTCASSAYHH
jgi:hypothetical protein